MSALSSRAMLVYPSISVWTARRHDRKVSEEVAKQHHAEVERAGRYNKCLIDVKSAAYLTAIQVAGKARRYHIEHTLPWSQDGAGILSSALYEEYTTQMDLLREEFSHAVELFIRSYPALKKQSKIELNGLYREDDYPTVEELRRKFGFRLKVFPVPEAGDFRVSLDNEDVEAIKANIEQDLAVAVRDAEKERWTRLLTVVEHAFVKLSDKDAIFRDSLIENIRDAVKVLPKLALIDNPDFDSILKEVSVSFAAIQPEDLRKDVQHRADTAKKAAAIASKMAKLFPK